MRGFEVAVECPVHKKLLFIKVSGRMEEAKRKVLGMTVNCPWQPSHKFVVGFRKGEKEIISMYPLEWLPPEEEGIISSAPTITPIEALAPTPLETFYYIDPDVAEKQLSKSDWWIR
jgi:hypothetical protein